MWCFMEQWNYCVVNWQIAGCYLTVFQVQEINWVDIESFSKKSKKKFDNNVWITSERLLNIQAGQQ